MGKIIRLSEELVSQIAAGEVIERPAYVVKELIENAIDAGADTITVNIEESGLKSIAVIDNGEGMTKEDLELSFLPHTTSKLISSEHLHSIASLGFRGEALASIAAVSTLTVKSRVKGNPGGTMVEVTEGELKNISPIGIPVGTTVLVENLFSSVPARKKFLKSQQTEFRHITEFVTHYALAYPDIHFHLTHNKKTIIDLPKKTIPDRIKVLLGESLFEHLLPLTYEDGYIKITGFIGKPIVAPQQKQFIFVNKRKVSDRLISLAAKEAYGTLLPQSQMPTFVVFLTLPYEVVDINVHPRKEQISFVNSRMIFDAVKLTVTETLSHHNLTLAATPWNAPSLRKGETQSFSGQLLRESVLPWNRDSNTKIRTSLLMQIHQTYILAVIKEGIMLIDQHAAHERILYESFLASFEKRKQEKESYVLSKPQTIDLPLAESQILEEFSDRFTTLGFHFEHFQGNSYLIRKAPLNFKGRNLQSIIRDMLTDFSDDKSPKSLDTKSQKMLAFLSCRAAVKSGDVLNLKQMKTIIKDLEETPNNATCPHGRPTQIHIPLSDLHKFFKRK